MKRPSTKFSVPFAPLATRAVDSMNVNQKRAAASDLAIVVTDTAVRLEGHDHFPWAKVAEALSTLDLPFALACSRTMGGCEHRRPAYVLTAHSRNRSNPSRNLVTAKWRPFCHCSISLVNS